ncbi:MAG: TlpA family protein disulfide reductase [Flavobacteriia bacterium]|nr:TlpA family protein disulfide reductase [Flavobacteriia bacterium]
MAKKLFSILLLTAAVSFSFGQESRFPDMILSDLDGNKVDIKALSQDGPVAISFWATWCGPCMLELNAINEVIDDWVEETGVKFYAISIDDSKTVNRVRPMVNGKGWDFNILLDTNNELKRMLNFSTPPFSLVVKNGEIVYQHLGYQPGAEDEFFEKIKEHSN